jgi:hypothetical protein
MAGSARRLVRAAALALLVALAPVAAAAQSIIRDAEIERALRELAAPVFREAGLPQARRSSSSTTARSTPSWPMRGTCSSIRAC